MIYCHVIEYIANKYSILESVIRNFINLFKHNIFHDN